MVRRNLAWSLLFLLLAAILPAGQALAEADASQRPTVPVLGAKARVQLSVFVLHSYSQEYPWTRGQHQGFMADLEADAARAYDVRVEYLDTKRVRYTPAYAQLIAAHLRLKYADYQPAAIYVSDDNALSFALAHAADMFPGVPVFFSGVNDYTVKARLDPHRITGIFEKKEIAPNLALIREISGDQLRIAVIGDTSATFQAIEAELRTELAEQPGIKADFISSDSLDDLITRLKQAGTRFVFLTTLGAIADANGRVLTLPETLGAIARSGNFVILSMEDTYIQSGVLGGWVTSGPRQGRAAAALLRSHLDGTALAALPPIEASPNEYIFDDSELARVGLTLPLQVAAQATHINVQAGFYETNRRLVLGSLYALIVVLILGLAVALLVYARKNRLIRASQNKLRSLYELAPVGIALTDMQGRFVEFNETFRAISGYSGDELARIDYWALTPPEYAADEARQVESLSRSGRYGPYEKEYRRKDGSLVPVNLNGVQITGGDGQHYIWSIVEDISKRRHAEVRLQLAASVFLHAREGIMITDADNTIVEVNDTFSQITGYSREDALGQTPRLLSSGQQSPEFYAAMWQLLNTRGHWSGEIWNRRKSGEEYAEMLTISAVRDVSGATQHYVCLFSDITPIKEHQRQLEHIAHYDALTGLPNRVLLADRLQQAMTQSQRRGQSLAVAYLDLDGFKPINDAHGHGVGDQLLISISHRMKETLREGDTLARLGGDEFVAVLVDLEQALDCQPVLARLLQAAALPVSTGELTLQVSASIGVTLFPQDAGDADLLMRHADQAMYQAKQAGKNRYHLFDVEYDAAVKTRHESLESIRRALDQRQFVLFYQPKVNMKSGEVIGTEALIRWQHPERGLLPPGDFLHVIEDHPISVELGEWVIDTALSQMVAWRAQGLDIPVSVNVGARQLQQGDFVARMTALMAAHPEVGPGQLELEILETSALEDVAQVSELMRACAALGLIFSLDDFGTGYSSLTYLKRLPAALLKIDQSFVRDMLDDPDDLAIVAGVVGLATAFHRQVIAEGVETVAHGTKLLALGCNLAQGYGIARPMPADALPGWVAAWRPDAAWTS